MPVSPLKEPAGVVTEERPFIQPTGPTSLTSSSQPATGTGERPVLQSTVPVSQFTDGQSQSSTGSSEMPVLQSAGPVSHFMVRQSQPSTGTSEIPVLQSTGPANQISASQTPISSGKKVLPTSSVAGAAAQQDPEPDFDHQTDPVTPVHPWRMKARFLTKRLVYQNLSQINSFLRSRSIRKCQGCLVIHGLAPSTRI